MTNRLEKYSNKKFETKNSMILVLRLDMEKKIKRSDTKAICRYSTKFPMNKTRPSQGLKIRGGS